MLDRFKVFDSLLEKSLKAIDSPKNNIILLPLLTVIGLLLRLFRFYIDPIISRDGLTYIKMSKIWHEADLATVLGNENFTSPFFSWILKLAISAEISPYYFGIILNIILGTSLIVIMYFVAFELFQSHKIAMVTSIFTAVTPDLLRLSCELQREMLYLFFLSLALLMILIALNNSKLSFIFFGASGFFAAFSFLSRIETLEFFILLILYGLILLLFNRKKWIKNIVNFGCFFISLLITFTTTLLLTGIGFMFYANNFINQLTRFFNVNS